MAGLHDRYMMSATNRTRYKKNLQHPNPAEQGPLPRFWRAVALLGPPNKALLRPFPHYSYGNGSAIDRRVTVAMGAVAPVNTPTRCIQTF